MIKHIIPILLLTAAFSSCKRNTLELPDNSGNDPVFRLEMNVDNSVLEVVAGDNDMYNHTSFDLDQDEVYTFTGMLANQDCGSECPNAYRFNFRNYETGADNVDINQSLSSKTYSFKNEQAPIQDAIEVSMKIDTEAEDPEFSWIIDDRILSNQQNLFDIFVLNIPNNERLFMDLNIYDKSSGLSSFSRRQIHLDENVIDVKSRLSVTQIEGDSVEIELTHSDNSTFNPLGISVWGVNDLNGSNSINIDGQRTKFSIRIGNGKDISNITAFFGDIGEGTENRTGLQIKYDSTSDEIIYHDADFDYNIEKRIAQGSDLALQSFEFEMYDESGTLYSSAKGEQAADAYFEIVEIEPYLQNVNGEETVKVTCQFSCRVFSQNGDSKFIRDAKAVVAVAIP